MLLSGERGKEGFLFELFSSALGRKCRILKNIYIRYEDNRGAGMMCIPLIVIGSGGILIAEEKHMHGFIEDPMRGDWRQFSGNRIIQFSNPIEVNSKRIKELEKLMRDRGFKADVKGIVVFTYKDVRFKNRLKQVYSAESSVKYIRSFMNNKCLTSSQVKSLCVFIRRQSPKFSGGNNSKKI